MEIRRSGRNQLSSPYPPSSPYLPCFFLNTRTPEYLLKEVTMNHLRSSLRVSTGLWLIAAVAAPLLIPGAARADQFVLFDVDFTFTKQDADNARPNQSHHYVREPALNPNRPRDWTSPVDYRNGTVHVRIEVFDRPASGEGTQWSLCYIPNHGQGNGYGCTGTPVYFDKGVFEKDVPMTSFWENNAIIWTEGVRRMDLVMK